MNISRFLSAVLSALLVGCVTINIYFPEAAAEQAADRIIDEVRGVTDSINPPASGAREVPAAPALIVAGLRRALDWIIPMAHAQADFDATSPATQALEQSLKARFVLLRPYLDSGAVGLTAQGLLDIRDRNAVPLSERNSVRQLVTEQNTDWNALYAEIARINDHPDWIEQIRKVFAERWVAKAEPGWYYHDSSGAWQKK